ncbi:TonB-dependent receptor [bacterium]|nr:TonB-dependent receptor [bacterium]
MRLNTKHRLVMNLVLLCFITQAGFAGTTGKIAGQVTAQENGDPLPGANIQVVGTPLGAAADMDGNFTILRVPPGAYDLQFSVIGYAKQIVTDVRVNIDQTARIDMALQLEALEGEAVTVVAERNAMKEDVATSVVAFSGDEMSELSLSTVEDAVELQAGVQDGLSIRGGGADEALFLVDGITLRDPRNNQPVASIALSAVQEMSIERGGFNAEYGQVRSGLVNIVTREGSKTAYHGSVTAKYGPPAAKHFGPSPFSAESFWIKPFVDDDVCWTGTKNGAWDKYEWRQYADFQGWNSVSQKLFENDNPNDDLSPQACRELFLWEHRRRPKTDEPDYNIDAGLGGPVPLVGKALGDLRFFASYRREREMLLIPLSRDDYLDYDGSLQLVSDLSESMKLRVTGLTGKSYNVVINDDDQRYYGTEFGPSEAEVPYWYPTQFIRTPVQIAKAQDEQRAGRIFSDAWYSHADVSYQSLALKLTHILSSKTYYEVSLEHMRRQYETGPLADRDTAKVYEPIPGYFTDEFPFGFANQGTAAIGGTFFADNHMGEALDSTKTTATTLKFDLTSQINFNNLFKTGVEFVYNDLDLDYGQANYFTGKVIHVREHRFPIRGAVYAQDKLETRGFIMTAGLRLDFSNANMEWVDLIDPFDKSYLVDYNPDQDYGAKKTKTDISLSPRLGISHPITENSKLFFNYGHFKQLPAYDELLRMGRNPGGGMVDYGDPNLALAKTVSYELGYDHVLFDNYLLQLAAFYHDITDQISYTNYANASGDVTYSGLQSNSYEDIRGFEASLRKTMGQWWSGFVNYTYQVNTSGYFGRQNIFQDPSEQRKYDENTRGLYQKKPLPQPYASASLMFHSPQNFGPRFLKQHPLGGWNVNLIYSWKAGEYIDWNPKRQIGIYDNVQVKDYHDSRLRLSKLFPLRKIRVTAFVEANNLFNMKRLSGASFFDINDFEDYMGSLHLPESDDYDNIVGHDRAGEYRDDGVAFQPIEQVGLVGDVTSPVERVIYYENTTGRYMQNTGGEWLPVEKNRMHKILDEKAYIDMPNQNSFNFLNPRQWFFGLELSFNLE